MPPSEPHIESTFEDADNRPVNRSEEPLLSAIIETRLSRREALGTMLAGIGAATVPSGAVEAAFPGASMGSQDVQGVSSLTFEEIGRALTPDHRVSPGHSAQVLLRWGDALLADAPDFDPHDLDAEAQTKQIGYNHDYIAFLPLPLGSSNSTHGLLCLNHEYTCPELMWPNVRNHHDLNAAQVAYEMTTHGHSVVEIKMIEGEWRVVESSVYNRRLTMHTPMELSGPAAGHDRMKTTDDPTGTHCLGTVNNCAGGQTPWGTVLIAEENFNYYFIGNMMTTSEGRNHQRYGLDARLYNWGLYHRRFHLEHEPNEPNRFGWVVELDPYDATSTPIKRTALGRIKHEGATVVINHDGRVVLYSGDDQRFEYVYKFVSRRRYDPDDRKANRDLLDEGTLYVAKFYENGDCQWLPLEYGTWPLNEEHDFHSQADVLIETRRAADLLGATPMDRPEDVEPNPVTGKVYVMLTNNVKRKEEQTDAANPRAINTFGHIIELEPPNSGTDDAMDHAALVFQWNIFLKAGDPKQEDHGAVYHPDVSRHGWLVNPDNAVFDNKGRLWIATDQGEMQAGNNISDGMWACDTEGEGRALTRMFFACPVGAEMCGPCFTPDGTTMFLAVQHPGEGSWEKPSTFEKPLTRWPDFKDGVPPRSAVVAVRREDGKEIG